MYGKSKDDEYFIEKSSFLPPLVIVPGLFGHRANWQSIAKALNQKLDSQVYVADLRNHGTSPKTSSMNYLEMAADLELLIESEILDSDFFTGFSKVGLLGHSMGGKVGTVLALSRPDLIDTLIIEDVTPKAYTKTGSSRYIPQYIEAMLELEGDFSDFSSVPAARKFANEKLEESVNDEATRQFLLTNLVEKDGVVQWKMNLHAIRDNLEDIVGFPDFTDSLQFPGPTLVISGSLSPYIRHVQHFAYRFAYDYRGSIHGNWDHTRRMFRDEDKPIFHGFFPDIEFLTIEGAGHWIHAEKPYEFMDAVQDKLIMA